MDPMLINVDDSQRAPGRNFNTRDFWRLVAMAKPYRRYLALGLLCTVLFAGLQTAGIGGAFPVFQILLEEEGLHGWVDRTVAGHRVDAGFAPIVEDGLVRVIKVSPDGVAHAAGIKIGDELRAADGTSIKPQLADLAAGKSVELLVDAKSIALAPHEPKTEIAAMHWLSTWIPPDDPGNKLRTLVYIVSTLVLVAIFSNVFRYFGESLIAHGVLSTLLDLRDRLYHHILRLPMAFFATAPTADLVTRFVQDIQEIQRGFTTLFGKFVREPLRAVFLIGWALLLDWRITITVAVVVPAAVAVFWAVGRSVKKANKKLLQAYGAMIAALTASLQNLRVVKAYTAEEQERKRLDDVDRRMFRQQLKLARLDAFLSPMMETLAVISGSVLTVWLASRVMNQTLSLSVFASLSVVLSMVFDPLRKMSDVYVRIQRATAGAERIFAVLDQPIEGASKTDKQVQPLGKALELSSVSFRYPSAAVDSIKEVSLTIARGESVALVGPNGCGKTTLVGLLLRLFDPRSGEVRYDGADIRALDLKSLREQFGLVTQEAVVFEGTPAENIAYGQESIDRARVESSAKQAFAEEFILNLSGAYDASIAERGSTLSGGQRQRLAIARAIYRNAPILIFDEATSQVDSESELKIQNAIREFAKGRTTIIIAHRLSTIQFADRIVVMDQGRIIDTGTHRELFDRCPLYRTLCQTQMHS